MNVVFYENGGPFLRDAGEFLASDPLRFSVIATSAERARRDGRPAARPYWFAMICAEGEIAGVAMRTHPDSPFAGFVASMSAPALTALAEALAARDERVPAWNGDLDAARTLCQAVARGLPVEVVMHTRLFEARKVSWPSRPPGKLRTAAESDEGLVADWIRRFHHDAELQGGRQPDPAWAPNPDEIRNALASRLLWLWEVDGEPVHLTGVNDPMFGAARIGPVFTPAEHRGHGYAGWVVASLTQQLLDAGARPCLYTDQANPVSNLVYERIGYERVHDEGNVVVRGS